MLFSEDCAAFVFVCFQGFRRDSAGPAFVVARLRHEQASRAAYLIWGSVHVYCAFIPLLSTQGDGEFYTEFNSNQECIAS